MPALLPTVFTATVARAAPGTTVVPTDVDLSNNDSSNNSSSAADVKRNNFPLTPKTELRVEMMPPPLLPSPTMVTPPTTPEPELELETTTWQCWRSRFPVFPAKIIPSSPKFQTQLSLATDRLMEVTHVFTTTAATTRITLVVEP